MNLEKLKDTARKYEQKEDWRRAIDVYLKAIHDYEAGKDPHPDLSLYNRVGDLYMKVNDTAAAVRSYERAADLYTEQGFLNNAIALCGKILRVNPGRTQIYFKLAQIHARKNMVVDAKRHLIDYIERMNRAGQLDEAFQAVTIFADQFQQNQEIRLMLIDLLRAASRDEQAMVQLEKLAADLEARGDQVGARKTRERIEELESGHHDEAAEAGAAAEAADAPTAPVAPGLVFLDVGGAPPRSTPPPAPPPVVAEVETPVTPNAELTFLEVPDPDESVLADVSGFGEPPDAATSIPDAMLRGDIELTLVGEAAAADIPPLDGLEREEPPAAGALQADDIDLMLEPAFETSEPVESRQLEGLELVNADIDTPPVDGFASAQQLAGIDEGEPVVELEVSTEAYVHDEFSVDELVAPDVADAVEAEPIEPVEAGDAEWDADDWSTEAVPGGGDDAVLEELEVLEPAEATAGATPAHAAGAPSIAELEEAVLDDPEDPRRHRALAEALLLQGETARAVDEFELALSGFELGGDEPEAEALVDVLVTLQPDEVRFFQRRVEYAYRAGDRDRLLGAYLDLGDALARLQMDDKAAAVFWRVLEHEPDNVRARLALQRMGELEAGADVPPLADVQVIEAPAYAEEVEAPAQPPAADEAVPAAPEAPAPPERVVTATPRSAADESGFVDLGALVIDGDGRPRDTRMTGVQLEPTGDEQQDFAEMLAQFKKGIEENVDLEDYEAHYDLGIAFKEMGLLDEAVAEFQKALRAPEGRLRTSEALGVSFYEKGQHAVAEAVLRRAVEALPGGDDEKIGLIYWLGRACEQQGKVQEARAMYERAVAVDIRFMDTSERIHRLTTGRP